MARLIVLYTHADCPRSMILLPDFRQSGHGAGKPTVRVPTTRHFSTSYSKKAWPQVEINSTFWPDGSKGGKKQVFLTPRLIVGRIRLGRRVAVVFGGGLQVAVTKYHGYAHAAVLTFRIPFK